MLARLYDRTMHGRAESLASSDGKAGQLALRLLHWTAPLLGCVVLCHRLTSSLSSLTFSSHSTRVTVGKSGCSSSDADVTKWQKPNYCNATPINVKLESLQDKEINWRINGAICRICWITSLRMTMCVTRIDREPSLTRRPFSPAGFQSF